MSYLTFGSHIDVYIYINTLNPKQISPISDIPAGTARRQGPEQISFEIKKSVHIKQDRHINEDLHLHRNLFGSPFFGWSRGVWIWDGIVV